MVRQRTFSLMFKLLREYTKDGLWAAILGPIFTIVEVVFDAVIPYAMALIIDVGINDRGGDINYIIKIGAIMVALALGAAITGGLAGLFSSIASTKFVKNIRDEMFARIQKFDFENIEKYPVPTVVMRLTNDMRMMRMAYASIVRALVRAPINLAISFYMVYRLNNKLASIFAIVIPVLGLGLYLIINRAHPRFRVMMRNYDILDGDLEENIDGIRVVKSFVREKYEQEKFKDVSFKVTKSQRHAESIVILNRPFFELTMYTCMILIAWFGGNYIITGEMTTGVFMSYLAYVRAILFALLIISDVIMNITISSASVDRANEILNEKPTISDDEAYEDLEVVSGDIEFKDVCFKYSKDAQKNVLSDVNLKIKSGEVIGILGPTGASKTTLVQLIPRLYDATSGEIYITGRNIKDYKLDKLRDAVAMVLQKNTLFSGTIEENMKWGNKNATHKQIIEACECAQVAEFIEKMPDKYNTDLGQGGVNVSGGQKQRLCIARALLKKPKIIILDDSTSAVDTDTDHRIQLALKEKLGGMTTIIIAQRVNSVKEANRIVIMNDGRIEDIGTHDELMKSNEVYRDLYNTQMEGVSLNG